MEYHEVVQGFAEEVIEEVYELEGSAVERYEEALELEDNLTERVSEVIEEWVEDNKNAAQVMAHSIAFTPTVTVPLGADTVNLYTLVREAAREALVQDVHSRASELLAAEVYDLRDEAEGYL